MREGRIVGTTNGRECPLDGLSMAETLDSGKLPESGGPPR